LDKRPELKKMDMRFGMWKVRSLYMAGSLITVAEALSKYKLGLMSVQEVSWGRGGTQPAGELHISMERGMRIIILVQVFLYIRESYQELRG
jgi:hypothetical protein